MAKKRRVSNSPNQCLKITENYPWEKEYYPSPPPHPMYDGGLTYLTDSLKFLSHNSKQKYSFFKNLLLIVWFFCLIVLLHRITQITELKNARSFRF